MGVESKLIYKLRKFRHAVQQLCTEYSFKQLKACWKKARNRKISKRISVTLQEFWNFASLEIVENNLMWNFFL